MVDAKIYDPETTIRDLAFMKMIDDTLNNSLLREDIDAAFLIIGRLYLQAKKHFETSDSNIHLFNGHLGELLAKLDNSLRPIATKHGFFKS